MNTVTDKKELDVNKDIIGDKGYVNSLVGARDVMKAIFGDDFKTPSHMSYDLQQHSSYYKKGFFGFQFTASQPNDRDFVRSLRIKNGKLDIQKVKQKFEEVKKVALETEEYYEAIKEYELKAEKERKSLQGQILSVFSDEEFRFGDPFETSYDREEALKDIEGNLGISNDMVTITAKGLTVEEARKVYEFVKELKK